MRWHKRAMTPDLRITRTDFHPDLDNNVNPKSITYEVKDSENDVSIRVIFFDDVIEFSGNGPLGHVFEGRFGF